MTPVSTRNPVPSSSVGSPAAACPRALLRPHHQYVRARFFDKNRRPVRLSLTYVNNAVCKQSAQLDPAEATPTEPVLLTLLHTVVHAARRPIGLEAVLVVAGFKAVPIGMQRRRAGRAGRGRHHSAYGNDCLHVLTPAARRSEPHCCVGDYTTS